MNGYVLYPAIIQFYLFMLGLMIATALIVPPISKLTTRYLKWLDKVMGGDDYKDRY